jgi:hypothetical protein
MRSGEALLCLVSHRQGHGLGWYSMGREPVNLDGEAVWPGSLNRPRGSQRERITGSHRARMAERITPKGDRATDRRRWSAWRLRRAVGGSGFFGCVAPAEWRRVHRRWAVSPSGRG